MENFFQAPDPRDFSRSLQQTQEVTSGDVMTCQQRGVWLEFCEGSLYKSGQIIATSADVTLNGGLIRELPQNPLNSGLGIILICPDKWDPRIWRGSKLDANIWSN